MLTEPSRRPVALALYRDPAQLACVEYPGFAGGPPSVIIELSLFTGLRVLMQAPDAAVPPLCAPLILAPTWRRTVPSLLRLAAEHHPAAAGPVMLVCHTRDACSFVDTLGPVDCTRLIWHPADRPDRALVELIAQVKRSALAPSLVRGGLYLSSTGRAATAEDWRHMAACPTLAGFGRTRPTPSPEGPADRALAGA